LQPDRSYKPLFNPVQPEFAKLQRRVATVD
jgi:hypothetical protein